MATGPTPVYHRSAKRRRQLGAPQRRPQKESWQIGYGRADGSRISPTGFKHTGLFPEQAVNWDLYRADDPRRPGGRSRVLNLFAYTGGATLACAAAGASVCHVDASQGHGGLGAGKRSRSPAWRTGPSAGSWTTACKFVQREIRRGSRYDAVIMDPPSYGRGPGGEVWKLEDSIYDLVQPAPSRCCQRRSAVFLPSTPTPPGSPPAVMEYIVETTLCRRTAGGQHPLR